MYFLQFHSGEFFINHAEFFEIPEVKSAKLFIQTLSKLRTRLVSRKKTANFIIRLKLEQSLKFVLSPFANFT